MIIIVYIALISVIKLISLKKDWSQKNTNQRIIVVSFISLFLITSLRSIFFTEDVYGYVQNFSKLPNIKMERFIITFLNQSNKSSFFYIFGKIVSLLGLNYRVWLSLIGLLFISSVSYMIKKYSKDAYLSYLMIVGLGYFYFSLTGLRQTISISLILLSFQFVLNRSFMKFCLLVILASLFHSSALVFIIAYPVSRLKITWRRIPLLIIVLVSVYLFPELYLSMLLKIGILKDYTYLVELGVGLSISGFLIQLIIFLSCLGLKSKSIEEDPTNTVFLNLIFMGLFFQSFSHIVGEFFRVSMYFSIFGIFLLPNCISLIGSKRKRYILYGLVTLLTILYVLKTGSFNNYKFFFYNFCGNRVPVCPS